MDQEQHSRFIRANRDQAAAIWDECKKLKEKVGDAGISSVVNHAQKAAEAAGNLCDTSGNLPFDDARAINARKQILQYNSEASAMLLEAEKLIKERE
ncbi:hypothetical protein [Agrobacterium sp. YIC 4121]|uniref:hypothetical protein n=1 Tax=Agrobacterium sp. YIC 4121 TaxID=1923829 RepID=UPI0009900856|nr:hypothetical protein [Agrobacterium sp. YIC 4121]OOO34578.1 hypothetical protein BTE54_07305 [Agrobacterium sp. YIC 4121]